MKAMEIRELEVSEWSKLQGLQPLMQAGGVSPNPATTRAIVAFDEEGRIRAAWFVFIAIHTEPVWIDEEYRNRPGLIRRLWNGVVEVLKKTEFKSAFTTVMDDDDTMSQAERLGFSRLPGGLYMAVVNELGPRAKES